MPRASLLAIAGLAALPITFGQNLPSYQKIIVPDSTPTRTRATTLSTDFGSGTAWFIGGSDADRNTLSTATTAIHTGNGAFTVTTGAAPFTPFTGATTYAPSVTGLSAVGTDISDYRTWIVGGVNPSTGALTSNVATFDPVTTTWVANLTTRGTQPVGRTGPAVALLERCDMSVPASPKPCLLMFGGQSSSGLLNDVWALWVTENPPRWELIAPDTASPVAGRPSRRTQAVGAPSGDGTTMFVYGGITSTGPTADMFALAPAGFPDTRYSTDPVASELINIVPLFNTTARQSSTLSYWGDRGPGAAVDGNLRTDFDASGYPFACTHTTDERTPWWVAILNTTVNVDGIRISPRSDCCIDRTRAFRVVTSTTSPNGNFAPPSESQIPGSEVRDAMPNLAGAPVVVLFSNPRPTRFLWVSLLDLGYIRPLTLCEVEIFVKKRWVWRQLSGVANVALNKPTTQNSFLTDWSGGDPSRAVDGITTNNYNSAPPTCTHTNGAPAGQPIFWQVDLGAVYSISQLRLWTRNDCCQNRNDNLQIHIGNSRASYQFDQVVFRGTANTPNNLLSTGIVIPAVSSGRYVTVTKPNPAGGDNSIITICELMVMAERLVNQPAPVRDFSSTLFRGNLVVFGGNDPNGFRVDSIRFFNLNTRQWAPAFEPLGTGPGARAFTGLGIIDSNRLLLHGGTGFSDVMSDMTVLSFPSCPAIDRTTGVQSWRCQHGSCLFTCFPGFIDQNQGRPVVCREDGFVDGVLPPCLSQSTATAPTISSVVIPPTGTDANTSVVVSWSHSGSFGFYGQLLGFRVQAQPVEFLETFENGFPDPGAWRQYTPTTQSASFWYFREGELVMDAGAGTDYWAWSMLEDIANTGLVVQACCQVRNGFILYRDWPAGIDVNGEWAIETQITATQMPAGSGMTMGLLDMGLNAPRGEAQFFWGFRYTDWNDGGNSLTLGFESLGGRTARIFPALANTVYLRLEKVRFSTSDRDVMGTSHGVIRAYYKWSAGAPWVRVYDTITYRETIGTYFNGTACGMNPRPARAPDCIDGPGMRWANIRPFFYSKSWNNNVYARAIGSFKYLKITQGLSIIRQPVTRILGHPNPQGFMWNTTTISNLVRGATYTIRVQARTAAGFGPAATQVVTMPAAPPPSASIVLGTREAALNRPVFARAEAWGGQNIFGNDGVFVGGNMVHGACDGLGDWWGVDLGVEHAAVRHVVLRNRCQDQGLAERMRHFTVFAGQDARGPWNTNAFVDQALWDNYTTFNAGLYRQNNVPNFPVRTIWAMTNGGPLQTATFMQHSATAWNTDPALCRATLPANVNGRYVYFTNAPGQCLHFTEFQVFTANSCPAKSAFGTGASVVTVGGRRCSAGTQFGIQCEHECTGGAVIMSGDRISTCNGERWTGGFASNVVCGFTCPAVEAPPMAATMEHEIFSEDMRLWAGAVPVFMAQRVAALDPIVSPLSSSWAYTEQGVQALGRLGTPVEPALVWVITKIRDMDSTFPFRFTTTFTTTDRAGLMYRVVDSRNYYRVYLDVPSGLHVAEAVVNGVPRIIGTATLPLRPDQTYTLGVSASGFAVNVTVNGRLLMQVSDRQFPQGFVGLYAQSSATFTHARFVRMSTSCQGATEGERCIVACQAGLTSRGTPLIRTCVPASGGRVDWDVPLTNATRCTLDPPSFPPATLVVRENSARNTLVGAPLVAQSSSPDYPVQFQMNQVYTSPGLALVGPDNLFSVDFCSGQVKVRASNSLDFEFVRQYILEVRAYVTGFTDAFTDRNITVNIIDVDEPPMLVPTTLTFPEDTAQNAVVGSVTWWDPENDTVAFTVDVDGSNGRFVLNPATGAFSPVSPPSPSAGFPSMFTGPSAPLNFEAVNEMEVVVTLTQTTCLRAACGTATPLGGSGTVTLKLSDSNDAPYFSPALQSVQILEQDSTTTGWGVGNITIVEEDAGQFAASPSFTQVDPSLCGLNSSSTRWPTNTFPPVSTLTIGSNNLFSVHPTSGLITMARQPVSGAEYASTLPNGDDRWEPFAYSSVLARAVYTVCVRVTDGFSGSLSTVAPVEVIVVANIPGLPQATAIAPALFPTTGNTVVNITGVNFQLGQPVTASYSNGVNMYNATGCGVITTTLIQCRTVAGVGGRMVWAIRHANKNLLSASPLEASYIAPSITTITGQDSMRTSGATVTMVGSNFGPVNSVNSPNPVTVVYGLDYSIPCTITLQNQTHIICTSSSEHGGRNMPYRVTLGGQEATTSHVWSYAAPTINSITVVDPLRLLNTVGGTRININGTNFGGITINAARGLLTTFGTTTGRLLPLPCTKPDSRNPHTYMECIVPAGVGVRHAVMIEVFGVAMNNTFGSLAYYPPVVTSISGQGYANADTSGGQSIVITGRHFGPICFGQGTCQTVIQANGITYGSDGDIRTRYTARGCVVSVQQADGSGEIQCLSDEGVGRNFRYAITVGEQAINNTGGIFPELSSSHRLGSYSPPNIASFAGTGAFDADTRGGQPVVIMGRNFGPANAYTNGLLSVSYGMDLQDDIINSTTRALLIGNLTFFAASCAVSKSHVEITCASVEGAGNQLAWDITLAGQKSATPTTGYAAPIIEKITYEDGVSAVTDANVDGGEGVMLTGDFFGPTAYATTARSLVQSVSYGPLGTEYPVAEGDWWIVDHQRIMARLSPGSGVNLVFRVMVADQVSTCRGSFSYAKPVIVSINPDLVGTFSDPDRPTLITVAALNLPLRDPRSRVSILFGNVNPRTLTPFVPQGVAAIERARNSDRSVNISFTLPIHGGGLLQAVRIAILPTTSNVASLVSAQDGSDVVNYRDPVITDVVVTKARFRDTSGNATNLASDLPLCPFTSGPAPWTCDDPDLYQITLEGSDFSDDRSDMTQRVLQRGYDLPDGSQLWTASALWRVSWEHSRIVMYTILRGTRSGKLRVNITSTTFTGSPATQSLDREFRELSPDISAITGAEGLYPTTGGSISSPIRMEVENLAGSRDISITVGGREAVFLETDGQGGYTPVTAATLNTWLADPKNKNGAAWIVYVQVPAGQGTNQKIQLTKTSVDGRQGSNTPFAINYQPPVLREVQVVRQGVVGARVTVTGFTDVVVPTDGVSAVVRMFGTNLGVDPAIVVGDAYRLVGAQVRPCALGPAPTDHTCYEFTAPEGEGSGLQYLNQLGEYEFPLGFRLRLEAGDQPTRDVGWRYEAPSVAEVRSETGTFPTPGGVLLWLRGFNFGMQRPGRPESSISVSFGRPSDRVTSWMGCGSVTRYNHTHMSCTLPEGSGLSLTVNMTVAGLTGTTPSVFSYDAPNITSIRVMSMRGVGVNATWEDSASTMEPGFINPVAHGNTDGRNQMTIHGSNFGVRDASSHCAFFTWSNRRVDPTRIHTCNDREDFLGEGEVPASRIISWTHDTIVLLTPPGLGFKDVELSIRGRRTGIPQYSPHLWRFVYNAPVIQAMLPGKGSFDADGQPQGDSINMFDTEGGETITFFGSNFGPTPRNTSNPDQQLDGEVFSSTLVSLDEAPSLPTAIVAIVFHKACISAARTLSGGRPLVSIPTGTVSQSLEQCDARVFTHTTNRLTFVTGSGIGRNRTAYVVVIDGNELIVSNVAYFSYFAPFIQSFSPNVVYMTGGETVVDVYGKYFGNKELAAVQGWTAEEMTTTVVIGGMPEACLASDQRREGFPSETVVFCRMDETIMPAGFRNVSVTVAGQTGRKEVDEPRALLLVCDQGYYGRVNETCLPCPAQSEDDPSRRGAVCRGYIPQVAEFEDRFSYPRPLKGWYNLNSSDMYTRRLESAPSMLPVCPAGFQDAGRDVCIVPCDPPESCLGDNHCAEGYTSKPPMWRCAYCDRGFYKRAGECVKCPDSPAALFIGFILLVIVAAGIGFLLNRKQINIAVISIGVDFFQVLGIFGQARIKWPPIVKELLHVLSAFNLNIEIVAPECLVPDVSYKQKFWFIMILPLCIAGLFGINYVALLAYKALIQGQPKKTWHTHRPALVSSCLVLLYLLYLYLTRTIFDVFNCGPTFPPDGKLYLQVVFEECGIPGGTQLTLMPYAIAGLAVYTCGYPVFIGWTIFSNRELVMEDQLLRAKNTGQDKLTNPRAYDFRLQYGRSYFQFKPDWCMWILAIIFRKFCIAVTAVVFGKNSSFQMAACLLIMFLAYAAQVQIRPYMSPGDFDEVLKSHAEASYTSAIHARLRSSLAGIESRGRKKAHKNLINFEGKVDKNAVFGVLTGFFFNYNTVEAIMTFCAVIVCLMAIMYQANELNSYYPESKDSVTAVLLIIVIWAIIYFFTVFVTEIAVLYNEDVRARQLARASRGSRGDKGKKAAGEDEDTKARRVAKQGAGGDAEINVGNVQATTNPMFLNSSNESATISSDDLSSTILAQKEAPPVELWRVFQSTFLEQNEQIKTLQQQLQDAKKQLQTASSMGTDDGPSPVPRAARSSSRTEFTPRATGEGGAVIGASPIARTGGKAGLSLAAARKSVTARKSVDAE